MSNSKNNSKKRQMKNLPESYLRSEVVYLYLKKLWNKTDEDNSVSFKDKIKFIVDFVEKDEKSKKVYNFCISEINHLYKLYQNFNSINLKKIKVFDILKEFLYNLNKTFLDNYKSRVFILYDNQIKYPELFIQQINLLFSALKQYEITQDIIMQEQYNNNNKNRLNALKEFKHLFLIQGWIHVYLELSISQHDDYLYYRLNNFFNEISQKTSDYSPIGVIGSYQGLESKRQFGRVYDGLNAQWNNQGNNVTSNSHYGIRQRPIKRGVRWVPNKVKFQYILKNKEKAIEIIENSDSDVIIPLKEFIYNYTIYNDGYNSVGYTQYDSVFNLLFQLCHCKNYISIAMYLYNYLYDAGITVDGNYLDGREAINFVTFKGENGTFLTPFYELYKLLVKQKRNAKKAKKTKRVGKTKRVRDNNNSNNDRKLKRSKKINSVAFGSFNNVDLVTNVKNAKRVYKRSNNIVNKNIVVI
jgi:hypothetical protein